MNAALTERLFRAIYAENIPALKKVADSIVQSERDLGHSNLADALERISRTEKPNSSKYNVKLCEDVLVPLPRSKRTNAPLLSQIPRDQLRHQIVLPSAVEKRILLIEQEFAARERLRMYDLRPRQKVLLHGPSGCGKTLCAERIAWDLGLPLCKVRFDSLLSSYFGTSASNLRAVFEQCEKEPIALLLDDCDFIARSRVSSQDVGEMPRIVNMLLTLLDEYNAPGLVLATTNRKASPDEAIFRRFDDIIELPVPGPNERERLLQMTLSAIPLSRDMEVREMANRLEGYSAASIVQITQRAMKLAILPGGTKVCTEHLIQAINESTK